MEPQEIRRVVRRVVGEIFELEPDEIDDEADFTSTLGGDSLGTLGLIVALEKQFGIHYSPTEAQGFTCIDEVVRVTGRYVGT